MRKQKEHLWIGLVFSSLVFSDFFPDHCPIYISYEPLIIHGGQVCGFWRKKKFHLNSSSATKSHGVEPSLAIFSACPLLPSSVPGAWPPKAQQQAVLLLGCRLGLPTQRHEMEPEEEKNYSGGHLFPPLLASHSGGGYVPLAHNSCSCGYLIFSGSSVRGLQITPFSPRVPAWCLSTHTDSPNAAHHPV